MIRAALITALLLITARVGAVDAAVLQGAWVVDREATWDAWMKRPEFQGIPEDKLSAVRADAFTKLGALRWAITADRMARSDGKTNSSVAYAVLSAEGDTIVLATTDDQKVTHRSRVVVDGAALRFSDLGEKAEETGVLILVRPTEPAVPAK